MADNPDPAPDAPRIEPPPAALSSSCTVHVLTVHGVGGHDHLSNLLRTYQAFRSNLTSVEPPVLSEDRIPAWRLADFDEAASPPSLRLESRFPPQSGGVGAVRLYEVNYSGFAGVIRRNQPIDLTDLFIGLDMAVCRARQQLTRRGHRATSRNVGLASCLQRLSSVFTAGTVPIIGLPSIVFRDYVGTFVATFTRFFEDIATFAVDKNGEQLISAHFDRTMATISAGMKPGDRLVVAAHSLGSVVAHNYVVRQWNVAEYRVPDTLVTFGSPIGLLVWAWLFLDFDDMSFDRPVAHPYFCWSRVERDAANRRRVAWINAVNCLDPIATAFQLSQIDLSAPEDVIKTGLAGDAVTHRYLGATGLTSVGRAHNEYLNDKEGFLPILLRAAGLSAGDPAAAPGARPAAEHWRITLRVLRVLRVLLFFVAWLAIGAYGSLVAAAFHDWRVLWFAVPFGWPPLTISVLAFCQRLIVGGPTKRMAGAMIAELSWTDWVAIPYRVRRGLLGWLGIGKDVDPMAPGASYVRRLVVHVIASLPSLVAMTLPVAGGIWLTAAWPSGSAIRSHVVSLSGLGALALFTVYVLTCAAHELVRTWRKVVKIAAEP